MYQQRCFEHVSHNFKVHSMDVSTRVNNVSKQVATMSRHISKQCSNMYQYVWNLFQPRLTYLLQQRNQHIPSCCFWKQNETVPTQFQTYFKQFQTMPKIWRAIQNYFNKFSTHQEQFQTRLSIFSTRLTLSQQVPINVSNMSRRISNTVSNKSQQFGQ